MAVINTLAVSIRAKADQFLKSMRKVTAVVGRVIGAFKRMAGAIAPIAAALLGLSGISLLTLIQQTRKMGDEVAKLSDELDISATNLLALRQAAQLTGTTVDILTKGLQRMSRRIGESQAGYGEAVKGFRQMGLAVEDLTKLDAFGQFAAIADSVAAMGSQAEKAGAVYTTFGRQGSALLNMFQLQKRGLEEVRERLIRLQGVITREELAPIEAMNDRIVDMKTALEGLSLRALIAIAPKVAFTIEQITEAFIKMRKDGLDKMVTIGQWAFGVMVDVVKALVGPLFATWLILREVTRWTVFFTMIFVNGFIAVGKAIHWVFKQLDQIVARNMLSKAFNIKTVGDFFMFLISVTMRTVTFLGRIAALVVRTPFLLLTTFGTIVIEAFRAVQNAIMETMFIGILQAQRFSKALKEGMKPGKSFVEEWKKAGGVVEEEREKAAKRVKMGFARVTLQPLLDEVTDLAKELVDLGDGLLADVFKDMHQYQKVKEDVASFLDAMENYVLDINLPNIEVNQDDRELLKKLFAPVAEFGTQAATKIIANNIPASAAQVVTKAAEDVKEPFRPSHVEITDPFAASENRWGDFFNDSTEAQTKVLVDIYNELSKPENQPSSQQIELLALEI